MSYCAGCCSWTPGELCDACSFHSARVWAMQDESYLQNQENDSGANQDGQTVNGGDNAK